MSEIAPEALISRYAGAPSRFLELPDGALAHYRDYAPSSGHRIATLVLLHGANLSLFSWEPWVRQLNDSFRVILLDLPGHGLTGATPDENYSPAAMARFVEKFLGALGLTEQFILAGHSMGGHVAWRYALAHPDRLTGLILMAPGGISDPSGPQARAIRMVRSPGGAWLYRALFTRARLASSLRAVVFDPASITPQIVTRTWELNNRRGSFRAAVARLRDQSFDPAMMARLTEIRAPVLLLWGREDPVFPLLQANVFVRAIPSATLIVYDRCGHWPMQEVAARSAADILTFVSQL